MLVSNVFARAVCALFTAVCMVAVAAPAHASHDDGSYDLPVWFTWNKSTLDVLIVPPNHGQIYNGNGVLNGGDPTEATPFNSYLDAIEDSIEDWNLGIAMFAPEWLKDGLVVNSYVVGRDFVPPSALSDPEVVIVTDESKGNILGLAFNTRPCLVDNSKFFTQSFTYQDMFNVNAQEYGHCLGLHHVVDDHPARDVMDGSYDGPVGSPTTPRYCVSNLDVKGLELVFGGLFGNPSGGTASLPVTQYATTCSAAAASPLPSPTPSGNTSPTPQPSPSEGSPTPAPSPSETSSPEPSPTATTTPAPQPTGTATPQPQPTETSTPSPDPSPSDSTSPSPEPSSTTPAPQPSPSSTSRPSPTPSSTEEASPSPSPTPEPSASDHESSDPGPKCPAGAICGTHGDDVLVGTAGNDVIYGFGGNDVLVGKAGNDALFGGPGADEIRGGRGADRIRGGRGHDVLRGNRGHDLLHGGVGRDVLYGGKGTDRCTGGKGRDRLRGCE